MAMCKWFKIFVKTKAYKTRGKRGPFNISRGNINLEI